MWFLSVGPEICLQLPSDSTSRWTPLLFGYTLPTIWACSGLSPVRVRPWRANIKVGVCETPILYYIWKELTYIYIEIQKPNRFKDLLHKIHSKLEDLLFSILQHTPDRFIPKSLMRWFEKYTNKRLAQLKSDVIRKHWQTIELEKAVDNIYNRQQS